MPRSRLFLTLLALQAAHSVEEYLFRLYLDFPPAMFVSGLFSRDTRLGFLVANTLLLAVGLLCYLGPVRRESAAAAPIMWVWVAIEVINGIGHPFRSLREGRYTAGTLTALALLPVALLLARRLLTEKRHEGVRIP